MTERDIPFWERKKLNEMTQAEWESICDGCGRCCLEKLAVDDSPTVYPLDVGCVLLDPATARCTDYTNRLSRNVGCFQVTPELVPVMPWLPPTCGYKRIHLGQKLDWWHPLISGDPNTVAEAGISTGGRFVTRKHAGAMEYHTVDWPSLEVTQDLADRWITAMFGGINASVPTPFASDRHVDLGLMAAHCFWLLENGCNGLAVLDRWGEVASLAVEERIAILQGLASRGVPPSKMLAGIGPSSVKDGVRIADAAAALGIRGIMIAAAVSGQVMPHDVLSTELQAVIQEIDPNLHLYLSLSAPPSANAACLTALETLPPRRLRGIRDEAPGCTLGLAAMERFQGTRFEVYTADETALVNLIDHGGAGLISPGANLLGGVAAQLIRPGKRSAGIAHATKVVSTLLHKQPAVSSIKALLARHTGLPQWDRVRLPLRPLGSAERDILFRSFDASGIKLRSTVQTPPLPPTPTKSPLQQVPERP